MTEWRGVSIECLAADAPHSVVGGPFGSALGRKDYVLDGVPVIRGAQLSGEGSFSLEDFVFVTDDKADEQKGNLAYPGDVIVTQRGTVGQIGLIPESSPHVRYLLSQSQMKLTVDRKKANSRFVYYALLSPEAQHALKSRTVSAGVPHTNLAAFRELEIRVPPLAVQHRVAGVLGSIDDLIENNRRRIELLEQMAQAIFREWFVHFRYPGHEDVPLVDSPHGPIPEGWSVGTLQDIVQLVTRSVDPACVEPSTPAVGLENIPRQQLTLNAWGAANGLASRKLTFEEGDILFGKIRPYFHKVSVAPMAGICSTDAIVLRSVSDEYWGLAVMTASSQEFVGHATQTANGTKMPRADWTVLKKWLVPIPKAILADQFSGLVRDSLTGAQRLMFANRALAVIRDLLLPKLVTGQIDVSELDLDALVESVA